MAQHRHSRFEFVPEIPLNPVDPGTNLLVTGPSASGARDVALRLLLPRTDEEGTLLISADVSGTALLDRCDEIVPDLARSRIGIVDCVGGDDQQRFDAHVQPIVSPSDLAGIELEFSILYETLVESGLDHSRIGLFSVTSILAHSDFQTACRFIHMLTGRIIATGDFGLFVADRDLSDERELDTIEGFCDGRIDVRTSVANEKELRVSGLDGQPTEWTPFVLDSYPTGRE